MNELSNIDISQILEQYGININGIYSKDMLPNKLEKGWYIINLQNHNKGNGSHWTCFYLGDSEVSLYFDSFGIDCPEHLHIELKPYIYNHLEIQNLQSSACGFFCIGLIKYIETHKRIIPIYILFERYCHLFSPRTISNDGILRRILKEDS